jgi:acetyl-CoA synthetase (ADP-forming)
MKIIDEAVKSGRTALSEYESKKLLARYSIPVTREILVERRESLMAAIEEIGYPIVLKGCSPEIAHKTEKDLIRVDIRNEDEALAAFKGIISGMKGAGNSVLVQEMVLGKRELVAGLTRDPQFGPCVMFGLGGIFTEVLNDVSFRVAPLEEFDALEMMREIRGHKILGAVRGMEPVDMTMLADILIAIGKIGMENGKIAEIDINPLIITGNKAVAVDALIVLENPGSKKRLFKTQLENKKEL